MVGWYPTVTDRGRDRGRLGGAGGPPDIVVLDLMLPADPAEVRRLLVEIGMAPTGDLEWTLRRFQARTGSTPTRSPWYVGQVVASPRGTLEPSTNADATLPGARLTVGI